MLPSVDTRHGIAHGVSPAALDEALTAATESGHPASAVYVVSPSYFGAVADVAGLSRVAHAHGAPLIVDGAWGPHFGFHPDLPESPARLGADLVVSSTHKLAGSLTQSAMLHLGHGPFADRLEPLIERAVAMTASTSSSALLQASLDIARHSLMTGTELIGRSVAAAESFRAALREDPRFAVLSDGFDAFEDIVAVDPAAGPDRRLSHGHQRALAAPAPHRPRRHLLRDVDGDVARRPDRRGQDARPGSRAPRARRGGRVAGGAA